MSIGSTGKVGEFMFAYNCSIRPEYNNAKCEIMSSLKPIRRLYKDGTSALALCYSIKFQDGFCAAALPTQLYRKPPKKAHTEWADKKVKELVDKSKQNTEAYVHSTV